MKNKKTNINTTYVLMSGWARSGAALSCAIINAHSETAFATDVVKYLNFCLNRYPILDEHNLKVMMEEMHLRLMARYSIDFDLDQCIKRIEGNIEHINIYTILLDHIVGRDLDKQIIGEYEGVSWGKVPYFLNNIDNSKAMMIVRDPRDVLVSFKKNTIAPGNDYLISVFNSLGLMESWIENQALFSDRFYGIRFEELKKNTEEEAHKITEFLGIDFQSKMLDSYNWKIRRGNGWKKWGNHDSSSFYSDSKLKKSPVGRWRELIDPVDHFICELIAGNAMKSFGIELEFEDPKDELFELAINRLMSSPLLRKIFLDYVYHNKGSERYPLDPCDPKKWDKRYIDNPDLLDLLDQN